MRGDYTVRNWQVQSMGQEHTGKNLGCTIQVQRQSGEHNSRDLSIFFEGLQSALLKRVY